MGNEAVGYRAGKFVLDRSMVSIVHIYPRVFEKQELAE